MIRETAARFRPILAISGFATQVAAICSLAACAGPIETRYGGVGPAPVGVTAVSILTTPGDDDGAPAAVVQAQARTAVVAELARRGIGLAPDSASRLELAITARAADSGVAVIGGTELSPAKKQRLLQSCQDTTYRLTLAYYSADAPVAVSRSWAEESHCHGQLGESLPTLARRAVVALVDGSQGLDHRSGVD